MGANTLLISVDMLKARTSIHGNIDEQLVFSDIKTAQDMYVHPILGTALYLKLIELINSGDISLPANSLYKTLLDVYIVDTLIYYTLALLPVSLSFQFWNKGVVQKQGVDTELPSMTELIDISNNYKHKAEFYANRLRLYLKENASGSAFSEYLNPGNGVDTINPQNSSFTMPVWLGDDCECGKSYEERYQGNRPNCCD